MDHHTRRYAHSSSSSSSSWDIRRRLPPNVRIDPKSKLFSPVFRPEKEEEEEEPTATTRLDDEKAKYLKEKQQESADGSDEENNDSYDDDDNDDDSYSDLEEMYLPEEEIVYAIPLPQRLHAPVYTFFAPESDAKVGTLYLDESVFGRDPVRVDLLKKAVVYIRAKKRGYRKAKTKNIYEVRGSKRKLRQQKGLGRARVGHRRPPHFRGGGTAHGIKGNTDYGRVKLNKKIRKLALAHALSQKLLEGNLFICNQLFDIPSIKTKDLAKYLQVWGMGGKNGSKTLIIDSYYPVSSGGGGGGGHGQPEPPKKDGNEAAHKGVPINFTLASANIPKITVGSDRILNVFRILGHEKVVLTVAAVEALEARLANI